MAYQIGFLFISDYISLTGNRPIPSFKTFAMPTFTTSIKLLAATDTDYQKLSQEMKKKSFHPANKPKIVGHQSEICPIIFNSSNKSSILDATTAVSEAVSSIGKKFSFTIMKNKSNTESPVSR